MVSQEEKTQGTLVWALTFFAPILVPLIFFLISKDKPFVQRHAAMALTVSVSTFIVYLISIPLMLILVGFVTLFAGLILYIVCLIMGAMAANRGDEYTPPLYGKIGQAIFKV